MVRIVLAGGAAVLAASLLFTSAWGAERTVLVPAPKVDVPAAKGDQVAVLAGGCFWGMEAVFEHLKGVKAVTSGYAGGARTTATYDQVSSETTGHAESVRVVYDPSQISYGTLLRVYFSVAHNPTELNFQGPDHGTSYRSAIFVQNPEQRRVAQAYIAQLDRSKIWGQPIVTKIETSPFYPAEDYHQNYFDRHPENPYITAWDKPKVAALRATFPQLVRG